MTGSSRTRGFVALGLLVALALGACVSGVFLYRDHHLTTKPFSLTNSGDQLDVNTDVSKVKAVAEQFALRIDSLDSKDVAGYVKSVGEMLSTRCKTDFDKTGPALASSIGTVAFTTKGFIRSTAITTLDRDSAVVLIVHDAEKSGTGASQSLVSAYRWTLSLVKVDGTWKVDKFLDPDRGGEAC